MGSDWVSDGAQVGKLNMWGPCYWHHGLPPGGALAGSARARQTGGRNNVPRKTLVWLCLWLFFHFAHHAHTLIMENTRRNAYDAAFKLKAIDLAVEEGNRAAARKLGINESMVRCWRRQREELTQCKKTTKAFRSKVHSCYNVDTCGLYCRQVRPICTKFIFLFKFSWCGLYSGALTTV